MDIITNTKGYKNNTLEPLTKKLNKQVYSLQKQCSFHVFLIGTGIVPCFRYQDSQEWQQSNPQSPKPYSLSHALCKSKKISSRYLTLSCDISYPVKLIWIAKVSVFLNVSKCSLYTFYINPAPLNGSTQFHYCTDSNLGTRADDAFVLKHGVWRNATWPSHS